MTGDDRLPQARRDAASGRVFAAGRRAVTAVEALHIDPELQRRWIGVNLKPADDFNAVTLRTRLQRDRTIVVPWLARTRSLLGARVLKVGCGPGASTIALIEQGAVSSSIDVPPNAVDAARRRVTQHGLEGEFETLNAASIGDAFEAGTFEWVIFWASLEHMTIDERLAALAGAWSVLAPGGLTIIETPNRLWYFDSHTSPAVLHVAPRRARVSRVRSERTAGIR